MNKNIFQRVEKKYLLSKDDKEKLFEIIKTKIKKDKYFYSKINNIYFDNTNNDLIINSIEKPIFKEKIRLRSYGTPNLDDTVFLEIKEKYQEMVSKRRIEIKLKDFYNKNFDMSKQIMKEIYYYFHYFNLKPAIYIGYDRESFQGIIDKNLRITLDYNLRSRRNDLQLDKGDYGKKYFKNEMYIMEIKVLGSMPIWLAEALSSLKIYPHSFSKYGKIYIKEINMNKEVIYA